MGASAQPAHHCPGRSQAHAVAGPAVKLGMVVRGHGCIDLNHAIGIRLVHEEQKSIRRPDLGGMTE